VSYAARWFEVAEDLGSVDRLSLADYSRLINSDCSNLVEYLNCFECLRPN
jgi:hypothetical protein